MIRTLLATTAIATLMATGTAMSQTAPAPAPAAPVEPAAPQVKQADGYLASNIIGETVYNGTGEDAENIGNVNDIVLDADGNIVAIVVGVGGFLGLGEKQVALEYDLVSWAEMDGDEYMVVETTRDALEAQEEFDVAAYEPQPADAEVGNTKPASADDLANAPVEEDADAADGDDMAAAPAGDAAVTEEPAGDMAAAPTDDATTEGDDMAAAPADDAMADTETTAEAPDAEMQDGDDTASAPAANTPDEDAAEGSDMAAADETDAAAEDTDATETAAIDRSTLSETDAGSISAEEFVGTTVYGANEENIGEIGDVILSDGGDVEAVIIDVGGFLGIGEKSVAVSMENLAFMSDEDGEMYLYTDFTQEQLEAQTEYDESTYADNRDDQLLIDPAN